ncbi:hypothetical protein [Thermaerobacter litoralis]
MPLEMLREEIRSGFELDEQVTFSELRSAAWMKKLAERGKLRVAHRQEVVGVLLSPQAWEALRQLEAYVEEIEERLEELEIERLWSDRLHRERRPAPIVAERLRARLRGEE